jgi:hypothetical protein
VVFPPKINEAVFPLTGAVAGDQLASVLQLPLVAFHDDWALLCEVRQMSKRTTEQRQRYDLNITVFQVHQSREALDFGAHPVASCRKPDKRWK